MRRTFTPLPILEREGVVIQSTGADTWRCKCPVHGGDGPSMAIRLRDGAWRLTCFACGFNGTAIGLVMALKNCDAREAVKILDGDRYEPAPVDLNPVEVMVNVCDAPGCTNYLASAGRTYKTPGACGGLWTTSATEEAFYRAELAGWWMGARGESAICSEHSA